ncbi:MAG: restriction endonuclease subunit S [Deltaproteobacteria bacterium]|nr:restriction endonuclease subunit S [Candidatus Tharpella sp.]
MSEKIPFATLAQVNPPINKPFPEPNCDVSFIPMQDVSNSGDWFNRQFRKLFAIGAGYTAFQEGDVLFAKITPCMENGKGTYAVGLVNGVGFGSTEFHILRAKEKTSSRFVFHWCNSNELRQAAEVQMTGSAGQKRVPSDFFSRFLVTRLESDEQRVIAAILDTIDETIRRTEVLIVKLRQIKAGMLHDLLSCGLDDNGELRDPVRHPEQFKDSPLGRIPKEWDTQMLSQTCDLFNGYAFKPTDWHTTGKPIIRIQNLNGSMDFNYYPGKLHKNYSVPTGSLLFAWSGNRGTSFGPFVWSGFEGFLNQHIFKVIYHEHINSIWFYYALNKVKEEVEHNAHGASGLVHVKKQDLEKYLLPIPSPAEQDEISKKVESIDKPIKKEQQNLAKIRLIKQGLMQDLLTGRIRVPESVLKKYQTEAATA